MASTQEFDNFIRDLPGKTINVINEIAARTGLSVNYLHRELYIIYDRNSEEEDIPKRLEISLEALRDVTNNVYLSPEAIPVHRNDIPPIDIFSLGIPKTNLIIKFYNYVHATTDTYPEYIIQSAFSMLATVAQRRIYAALNGKRIFTNLWQGNTGPSGYGRKSAAISKTVKVVINSCGNLYLSQDLNPASLIEALATEILEKKTDHETGETSWVPQKLMTCDQNHSIKRSQRTFIKDEFGQLLVQLDKATHSHFKDTFLIIHGGDDYEKELINKYIIIKEPYMCMYWSTTVGTLKRHVTKKDIESGWLARTIIVEPSYIKDRNPLVDEDDEDPKNAEKRMEIEAGLKKINRTLRNTTYYISVDEGTDSPTIPLRARFQRGVLKLLEDWVAEREKYYVERHDELMGAYIARFQENAVRLAILIELGNIPELMKGKKECKIQEFNISKASMQSALKLIDVMYMPYSLKLATDLKEDNSGTAQSGVSNAIVRVEKQLASNLKIDWRTCQRNCSMTKDTFKECIDSLEDIGAVERVRVALPNNKFQEWLAYIPPELRYGEFRHTYTNVKVARYKCGITYTSFPEDKVEEDIFSDIDEEVEGDNCLHSTKNCEDSEQDW